LIFEIQGGNPAVTDTGLVNLVFILIFFGLIIISAVAGRNRPGIELRQIPAFNKVRRAIELTVEAGSRLHISIGRGTITGPESAAAFVGLSMLEQMTTSASTGDSPPIVTTGDPALAILAQDTLKSSYREIGQIDQYDRTSCQLSGLSPFSYAAGAIPVVRDKKSSTSILIGNFGMEVALLTDGCERSGNMTLAGTDDISAQAVLYATASEPLIGEELYAGGAYVGAGPMHTASLRAQDAVRWLLVIIILVGILLNLLSLDQSITEMLRGLL
jgi:hypothetical protein